MSGSPFLPLLAAAEADAAPEARERAFAEVLRFLRIIVRAEMGRRLRARRESVDICQSVAKSFADDWQAGRIAFESEAALTEYLRRTVRSKLADAARRDAAAKRGGGHEGLRLDDAGEVPGGVPGPATVAALRELQERLEEQLSAEDRRLLDLRRRGLDWEEVAGELGLTAAAARKRYSRLQERLRGAG